MSKESTKMVKLRNSLNFGGELWTEFYDSMGNLRCWKCNTCIQNFDHFGSLAILDEENGTICSALIPFVNAKDMEEQFRQRFGKASAAVNKMLAERAREQGHDLYVPMSARIGTDHEGDFWHFCIEVPQRMRVPEIEAAIAKYKEKEDDLSLDVRIEMLTRILNDYSFDVVCQVDELMQNKQIDAWDRCADVIHYLRTLHERKTEADKLHKTKNDETLWLRVQAARISSHFLHSLRNGLLSTLLRDLSSPDISFDEAEQNWIAKNQSSVYKRSQSLPSDTQRKLAEKALAEMKITDLKQLARDYLYDITPFESEFEYLFRRRGSVQDHDLPLQKVDHKEGGGLLSGIKTKPMVSADPIQISWQSFRNSVLNNKGIYKLEFQVSTETFDMCTLVVSDPVHPIYKWHHAKNGVAWFYTTGKKLTRSQWNLTPDTENFVEIESIFPFPHQWTLPETPNPVKTIIQQKDDKGEVVNVKKENVKEEVVNVKKDAKEVCPPGGMGILVDDKEEKKRGVQPHIRPRFFMYVKNATDKDRNTAPWPLFPEFFVPQLFVHRKAIEQLGKDSVMTRSFINHPMTGFELALENNNALNSTFVFRVTTTQANKPPVMYRLSSWS
jgi:hypothetical protein